MDQTKTCSYTGCEKKLISSNKSGYCTAHFYHSKKKNASTGEEPRAKSQQQKPKATPARKNPANPALAEATPELATIHITEAHLDRFWIGRSLAEKADLFSHYLTRS